MYFCQNLQIRSLVPQNVLKEKTETLHEICKNLDTAKKLQDYFIDSKSLNQKSEIHFSTKIRHSYVYDPCIAIGGDFLNIIKIDENKTAVLSLVIDGVHPFDLGTLLDQMGVAIRTGNHCAQPLMACLEIPGTLRASFALYNTKAEVDIFIDALKKAINMLS